ncbi:alpha/beta hydrolase family protein [Burkholderia multivorans]|nr:alpha/beta hydrolase family protein [Burkholderia multivorans]
MPKTYADQPVWRDMQKFLPPEFQWNDSQLPHEEWWNWHGNRLHLDTYRNPQAKVKVILFHGVGTNGRQMSMILGEQLARRGYETIAVDMPEYGMTEVAKGALIRYDDWVQAGSDLIDAERAKDDRPIVLYGLSNRLPSQALWSESSQGVLDLTMALSMVRSLRMQATNATLGSLPAAFRR